MSSSIFSEDEDLFEDNDLFQIQSLSNEDIVLLIQEVVQNKKMPDGSALCFQFFSNVMSNSIRNNTFNEDYVQLNTIVECINHLNKVNKFKTLEFSDLLLKRFRNIPLEVVWWLHKHNIMYFSQYCNNLHPIDLEGDILKLFKSNKENKTFPRDEIIQEFLAELIRGCNRPRVGIYRLPRSTTWSNYCFKILNNLMNETLKPALEENDNQPFINLFPFIRHPRNYIPSIIFKKLYANILEKILLYNVDEFDLFGCYVYQQLWCSKKIHKNLLIVYEEIFTKYCNMQTILEIIEEHEEKVNLKLTLAAVGVCVKKSSTGCVDAKSAAIKFINDSFKGGRIKPFVKAILFIRQACMEKNMTNYQTWYSSNFGLNGNFKTTSNGTLFKFFITTFTQIAVYEPKVYLKIQIDQSLSAPPNFNYLIHDYKRICRGQLEELKQSPSILIDGVEISVLHIVEECSRKQCITPMMIKIILTHKDSFYDVIVPQILRNKAPFIKVKELLLKEKYLSSELLHFSCADPEGKIFDDADEDFVVNKVKKGKK